MKFEKVVKVVLKQLAFRYWASSFVVTKNMIVLFNDWNDWIVESDRTRAVKGMYKKPSIWFIFPEKNKLVALTTWIHFDIE